MADVTAPRSRPRRNAVAAEALPDTRAPVEALTAAQHAAEAANARLADSLTAAEAVLGRLAEQMRAAEAAGEAALAGLNATIGARVAEAEAAAARAAEAAAERFNTGLEAAEATGERLRSGLTEALAAAEEGYGQLAARAEAQRQAAMEPFAVAGVPDFEAVEAVTEGLSEARRHMLGFVSGRIQQALETQAELMACRNLAEMRAVQQQYMRAAVSDYVTEAGALTRMGSELAARAMPRAGHR